MPVFVTDVKSPVGSFAFMTTSTPASEAATTPVSAGPSFMLRLSAAAVVFMVASAWVAGLAILQLG